MPAEVAVPSGVEGYNKREVYVVLCQVGMDTCFAANPNRCYILQQ